MIFRTLRMRLAQSFSALWAERIEKPAQSAEMADQVFADARRGIDPQDLSRFEREIVPHFDAAYNFACYLCRDPTNAEDIVQDAFMRALRGYAQFRGGDAKAWIFTIVRNCHHTQRNKAARAPISFDPTGSAEDALSTQAVAFPALPGSQEDWLQTEETAQRLRAMIGALPETFREVLVLREFEELSYREIAEIIGAPTGTVMSRLARARALLAKAWRAAEREMEP